jgi:6-phosphogluconolactonase
LAASPARESFPWQGCDLFFGDERCVPPSDPESNFGMVKECLLRHVPMPEQAVHRIYGELEPELAARRYEERLRALGFATQKRFDLVLLGLGSDGHTASLFPNAAALEETGRLVVSARAPTPPLARVTLTLPVINAARQCLFLVSGSEKAQALAAIARGSGATLPASSVVPAAGQLRWLVDRAAASGLE